MDGVIFALGGLGLFISVMMALEARDFGWRKSTRNALILALSLVVLLLYTGHAAYSKGVESEQIALVVVVEFEPGEFMQQAVFEDGEIYNVTKHAGRVYKEDMQVRKVVYAGWSHGVYISTRGDRYIIENATTH